MPLDVTLMIASVGSWMTGSGTVSTRTSRVPCQVSARMGPPCPRSGRANARMLLGGAGYPTSMSHSSVDKPGDHSRIEDKKGFTGNPEPEGVPEEEHMQEADVEEQLDEEPEEASNREDVPGE